MGEIVKDILLSPNAGIVLVFLTLVLVIGVVLSKTGILQVHTEAVQIGAADRERNIIRQQLEWSKQHLRAFEVYLPKDPNENYLAKYVTERMYDKYVDWITLNHLSKSMAYIEIKQEIIVNLVMGLVHTDEYQSEELKELLRKDTKESIEALLQIREVYK